MWIVIAVVVVLVLFALFAIVQRKRRAGTVIAADRGRIRR